ncbi:MAG TPA: carbohydrate ABC transporter permease [Clostridiaceae bacterium]|nr:carbohydrate ABC transporter permease [Clostridiaceae bacterium]
MIRKSTGEKIFQVVNIMFMLMIIAAILFPLLHIFSISVSESSAVTTLKVGLLPIGFNLVAYKKIIGTNLFQRSLFNTVLVTFVGTVLSVIVITMLAYALSRRYFFGKKFVTYYLVITMYFSGGLIPTYILITNYLNLENTYLAYILPSLVSVFYVIVVKSQIEAVPSDLVDSGAIDGAGEFRILFNIIIPVITPTIAAVSMFLALGRWNMWFPVLLYASKKTMWTLQYYLRSIVFEKSLIEQTVLTAGENIEADIIPPQNYQMASIIVVALPVVCIYPFIQKYFVKGILAGSVKG